MSRTLVTGAAGFTGRYLVEALFQAGHQVYGISHGEMPPRLRGLERMHVCDLSDISALSKVVQEVQPDHIVHLAAISFVGHDDVEAIYRTNIVGTRNLLQAATKINNLRSILVPSSANIYGNQTSGAIREDAQPAPINDYGISKLAVEHVARMYSARLPIVVVRPFNYTGAGQSTSFLIPKIISMVKEGRHNIELGNLDVARDFSDVRDIARTYSELIENPRAIGRLFNICSGKPHSLRHILEVVREISQQNFTVTVNKDLVRANEVKILWGDRSKLDEISLTRPNFQLRDTIQWMLE